MMVGDGLVMDEARLNPRTLSPRSRLARFVVMVWIDPVSRLVG